ncbi:hypothetical protein M1B72_13545 [Geomonas paludis]|uniref:Uncharacterized protein n=1 Tax=Geomonas paludis TaxID=2740185 RepID=A0A6V8MWJ8_9BACT|nr:hypothetical protein [Geomonas paludis]UPU34473.1 hypothetical protein M1B72_13545 [Geomonas paludis]GFO64460.1 hypothetical protein GMPD_23790 [Geomonas paludis]
MKEKVCVVCLKAFAASVAAVMAYVLDGRTNDAPAPHGILSGPERPPTRQLNLGLCPEHEEYFKEGLVAVIEIETVKSQEEYDAMASQAEGRTGNIIYLPKEVVVRLADFPPNNAVVFCEQEPFERLKEASKNVWS